MVQIYVDALADLSESYKDVKVLPYLFDIEGKKYLTSELSPEDIYNYLSKGIYPKTSRPSLGIWSDMIEEDLKQGNDILYIGSTSKMTGALSSINVIKNLMKDKYPDRTIETIDTCHTAGTINLITKDILNNRFNSNNYNFWGIVKNTHTFYNNNRFMKDIDYISVIKMENGVAIFDSSYSSYEEAIDYIKNQILNPYSVDIEYSYDMKNNDMIYNIKNYYLGSNDSIGCHMINSCMYSYLGLGTIGVSIKKDELI